MVADTTSKQAFEIGSKWQTAVFAEEADNLQADGGACRSSTWSSGSVGQVPLVCAVQKYVDRVFCASMIKLRESYKTAQRKTTDCHHRR